MMSSGTSSNIANTSGAKREASELFEPLAKRSDFEKLKNL